MLRIFYSQNEAGGKWTLCGQLAGPWVQELRACWQQAPRSAIPSRAMVDLTDVTFIDEIGETLLGEMRGVGVEFVAAGVETQYLLDNLKAVGERPLRRLTGAANRSAHPCGSPEHETTRSTDS
jgi:hypothetical protein